MSRMFIVCAAPLYLALLLSKNNFTDVISPHEKLATFFDISDHVIEILVRGIFKKIGIVMFDFSYIEFLNLWANFKFFIVFLIFGKNGI